MAKLTARQQEIFELIQTFIETTGMPPTRAEIAERLGFRSINAAEDHLKALARKGVIELLPGASRGIRLTGPAGLPVIGRVAAGSPILAQEHLEDHYRIDPDLFRPRADFLLRVSGESMKDAGINDGDLLAVHNTSDATNGQIVVARIEDDVTVKEWRLRGSKLRLIAHNEDFDDIEIDLREQQVHVEGLGVGVVRNGRLI